MTQTNVPMKQKETCGHKEKTGRAQGQGLGGGLEWEAGVSRCKLSYVEAINSKVPLCATDSHIQHPVINIMEKNIKRIYIHMCVCVCITKSP